MYKDETEELCCITVVQGEDITDLYCEKGSILMDVLNEAHIHIDAPCGGKALCGKCKVKISGKGIPDVTQEELKFITQKDREQQYRLACLVKVIGDIKVILEKSNIKANIMSVGRNFDISISPYIKKKYISLDKPTTEDQRDDLKRLLDSLNINESNISLSLLKKLPSILRENNYNITVIYEENNIISIEGGDSSHLYYGIAIDIGTTTVVAYLIDLNSGKQIDVISGINNQKSFGDDVISRIEHTIQSPNGLNQLQQKINMQINDMISLLANNNNISLENIYNIVLVANTTMVHMLLAVPSKNIAVSPFLPVFTQHVEYKAKEIGFDINDVCVASLLPCISAYVGSDITAAILSSEIYKKDELGLIIDIGTNGEIALGNSERLVLCSTAAGPAFEGAHIKNGTGGVAGAINTVKLDENKLTYTTINGEEPIGVCGSGIIDIIAILLEVGIIDETGRILEEDEIENNIGKELFKNIIEIDQQPAFVIVNKDETKSGDVIVITQKDIRQVQLSKAAIAAGIKVLVKSIDKKIEDITTLYLAGGFGSYIDKHSAVRIGLLPYELKDNIVSLGNAAATGAMMSLLSYELKSHCNKIKEISNYIELSNSSEFQDEYVECMYF